MDYKPIASYISTITVLDQPGKIVKIIESGWPDRYHAVTENGVNMKIKYELLFAEEIKEKYNFDPIKVFKYYNEDIEKI